MIWPFKKIEVKQPEYKCPLHENKAAWMKIYDNYYCLLCLVEKVGLKKLEKSDDIST